MNDIDEFEELIKVAGEKYNCDKITIHNFHKYYSKNLFKYRNSPIKLLEIGIGGENYSLGGSSLKLWEEVLPQATIYGWDIYPKNVLDTERIKTFVVDQGDINAISSFVANYGPFDVVIDDGSHFRHHQLTSLFHLIESIKPGGIYVIEDYFTSYWPLYGGSSLAYEFLDTPIRWIKKVIDIINRENFLSEETKAYIPNWNIEQLHVCPGVAFLIKGVDLVKTEIPSKDFFNNQLELDTLRYGRYQDIFLKFSSDPIEILNILLEIRKQIDSDIDHITTKFSSNCD